MNFKTKQSMLVCILIIALIYAFSVFMSKNLIASISSLVCIILIVITTMCNIKNISKDDERDWKRKVREITRAINVEKKLSKSQILELYLNLIYMGGQNIHGIALRK